MNINTKLVLLGALSLTAKSIGSGLTEN